MTCCGRPWFESRPAYTAPKGLCVHAKTRPTNTVGAAAVRSRARPIRRLDAGVAHRGHRAHLRWPRTRWCGGFACAMGRMTIPVDAHRHEQVATEFPWTINLPSVDRDQFVVKQ